MKKKLSLLFFLGFFSVNVFGQLQFLVEGGVSYTTMTVNNGEYRFGGRLAGGIDMPLGDFLTFQPMLELAMKGYKETHTDEKSGITTDRSSDPIYVEIPLKLSLNLPVGSDMDWSFNAGPYVGYGFYGKYESDKKEEDSDMFGSDGRCKNLDVGIAAGTKILFRPFYITLDAEWGLLDISKDDESRSMKTVAYSAGIGFIF